MNPRPMLQSLVDADVRIRLKWGQTEYTGRLVSVDSYMNVQLSGAVEWIDGKNQGVLGQVLIRDSWLGPVISTTATWVNMTNSGTVTDWHSARFAEYRNSGPGAAVGGERPQLSDEAAAASTPASQVGARASSRTRSTRRRGSSRRRCRASSSRRTRTRSGATCSSGWAASTRSSPACRSIPASTSRAPPKSARDQ